MVMYARTVFFIFTLLAATSSLSFSQERTASSETYTADVYKGSSPPSDELIVARVVWELKNKKGTIQEALNDDTARKKRIFVRGTHKVNDQHFYVFINGEADLGRAEMYKLGNDTWVLEKPDWLISQFAESFGDLGSTLNGFMTIYSR